MNRTISDELLLQAAVYARPTVTKIPRRHPDLIDDTLQTAALKAYRNLSTFRGKAAFRSWFMRIAINESLMTIRKNRQRPGDVSLDVAFEGEDGEPIRFELPSEHPDPERIAIARNEAAVLLMNLSPRHRQVLRMVFLGYDRQEIAKLIGTSLPTAKSIVFRMRAAVREKMESLA